jgi:hypothetical protein
MTTSMKLTKVQRDLLHEIAERDGRMHLWATYKPIVRLHELGLVDKKEHGMGSNPSFGLTDLGRAAISGGNNG